jgi:hypothetical protein
MRSDENTIEWPPDNPTEETARLVSKLKDLNIRQNEIEREVIETRAEILKSARRDRET